MPIRRHLQMSAKKNLLNRVKGRNIQLDTKCAAILESLQVQAQTKARIRPAWVGADDRKSFVARNTL